MGMDERDKVRVREEEGQRADSGFPRSTATAASESGSSAVRFRSWRRPPTRSATRASCSIDTGRRVARYDKIHLFWFEMGAESYSEPRTIEAGKDVVVLDSPFGRIGPVDLLRPALSRALRAMKDVDLILAPSAFTATTGKAHWETLIRARAIENLAYVLAPAQGGHHANGRETHGDTMLVDPWGVDLRIACRAGRAWSSATSTVNAWRSLRKSLPALDAPHTAVRRVGLRARNFEHRARLSSRYHLTLNRAADREQTYPDASPQSPETRRC